MSTLKTAGPILCLALLLGGCGDAPVFRLGGGVDDGNIGPGPSARETQGSSILDLFDRPDPNVTVEVNKYIWRATLEVLNFMPIETLDSFSGVIVYGYGTPPGGRTAYRATVLVQDPALDARSLKVSLNTRGGPVSAETQRAVENAILTRARELRILDDSL